jgi:hypothetical protein
MWIRSALSLTHGKQWLVTLRACWDFLQPAYRATLVTNMNRLQSIVRIATALAFSQIPAVASVIANAQSPMVIVESSDPDAYFGTATLLRPDGSVLSTQSYLFLSQAISPDSAANIQADPLAPSFPILENNITQFATVDNTEYLLQIFNTYSGGTFMGVAEPFYNPNDPLTFYPASADLTQALHNLPLPPGTIAQTITDTGDVQKTTIFYVVDAFAPGGTNVVLQASIALRVFEHDYTAVVSPAPEPSTWLLMAGGMGAGLWRVTQRATRKYRL